MPDIRIRPVNVSFTASRNRYFKVVSGFLYLRTMLFLWLLSWFWFVPAGPMTGGDDLENKPLSDSLTVYIFLADQCMISQFYTPELTRLYEKYHPQNVGFIGYFPNTLSTPERIDSFALNYRLTFPLLEDYDKKWTHRFGITVTPEVAVWNHRTDQLIYRGRIDDSYVRVGKRKLHPQSHDLVDVVEGWMRHEEADTLTQTQAIGCLIGG